MNYFHWGARMLGKSSPALLLIGGTALALCSQPVRRGLHHLTVQATKGILIANDEVKKLAAKMKERKVDNESEARVNKRACSSCHGRRIAVAEDGGQPYERHQATGQRKVRTRPDKRQIMAQKITE